VRLQYCVLCSLDPRPDISATLLYDFLEVAGSALYSHYGQQFQKLLHLICKEYFPKIKQVLLLGLQEMSVGRRSVIIVYNPLRNDRASFELT